MSSFLMYVRDDVHDFTHVLDTQTLVTVKHYYFLKAEILVLNKKYSESKSRVNEWWCHQGSCRVRYGCAGPELWGEAENASPRFCLRVHYAGH